MTDGTAGMGIRRAMPNIAADDLAGSRDFYVGLFGFEVRGEFDGMVFLASPVNPTAQIRLFAADGQTPRLFVTVEVADVDAVHAAAVARGLEIVEPLHDLERHAVRRFKVLDPDGVLLNVMTHLPG